MEAELAKLLLETVKLALAFAGEDDVNQETANEVQACLLGLFKAAGLPDYEVFARQALLPTLAALFARAEDDRVLKTLHFGVLALLQSRQRPPRLAALAGLGQLVEAQPERYQLLAADAFPFLAELLDGPDAEVEKAARALVASVERTTGESIG